VKTYNKRIGFLVSSQTLIPHGGIGQFAKSFCELMESHDIKVDIITDKAPQGLSTEFLESFNATVIYPDEPLKYTDHSAIFMYEDSYCYERMANFRSAIIKAFSTNIYETLVCNTYETVQVASTMGLEECVQIIAYTHLESQIFKDTKNPFTSSVNEMMRLQLLMNNITIGTQSKFNRLQFEDAVHLPIPITERGLLEQHIKPREGILFIGRWEEGKNPELFIDLIEQTKLPAKVMTSTTGAKKFEERLKKIGATYEIKVGIIGQEKVDFITSARVAFNPSTVESYGMAFYEQTIQLPTFCLENQRWTQNFSSQFFFTTDKRNMAEAIKGAYEMFDTAESWYGKGWLENRIATEDQVFHKWNSCFSEFEPKKSNNNTAKICNETTTKYADFVDSLKRRVLCIDDIKSVLTNKYKFRLIYTDTDTYLTKDPHFEPTEEVSGLSLFAGL